MTAFLFRPKRHSSPITLGVRGYSRREQVIEAASLLDRAGHPKGQSLNVATTFLDPPSVDQGDPYGQA
jgi:hypothetical protein